MASGTLEPPFLPDLVIDKILQFLPTKTAVHVSFLSNQWQGVVSSFPALNIDEDHDFGRRNLCYNYSQYQHPHQHIKFINFMKRYLDFRDKYGKKEPLEKLSLHMRMYLNRDQDIVTKWLMYACQDGLKELDVNLISSKMSVDRKKKIYRSNRTVSELRLESYFYDHFYPLPLLAISSAKSLTSLKLGYVKVPNFRREDDQHVVERLFPSLKILSLNAVRVATDEDLHSVLCECPSIEHLSLTRCPIGNYRCHVCCSSLKYLEVKNCLLNDILVDKAIRLESFSFVSPPDSTCEKMFLNSTFDLKYINISVDKYIGHFSLQGCHAELEASIQSQRIHRFEFFDGYLRAKVLVKAKEGTIDQTIIDMATILVELSDQEWWFSSDSTYVPRLVTFLRRFSCCEEIILYIPNFGALTIPQNYRKMTSLPPWPKTKTLEVRIPKQLTVESRDYETLKWMAPSARILIKEVDGTFSKDTDQAGGC